MIWKSEYKNKPLRIAQAPRNFPSGFVLWCHDDTKGFQACQCNTPGCSHYTKRISPCPIFWSTWCPLGWTIMLLNRHSKVLNLTLLYLDRLLWYCPWNKCNFLHLSPTTCHHRRLFASFVSGRRHPTNSTVTQYSPSSLRYDSKHGQSYLITKRPRSIFGLKG